jgi:hypothetical protein
VDQLAGIVGFGDTDALGEYERMAALDGVPFIWLEHTDVDYVRRVKLKTPQPLAPYDEVEDWAEQPLAHYGGVTGAATAVVALRRISKRLTFGAPLSIQNQ